MLFFLQAPSLPLVPMPVSVRRDGGSLVLSKPLSVVGEGEAARMLTEGLRADGVKLGPLGIKVTIARTGGIVPEGYVLKVAPDGITILATTPAGLFYGGQTLRQLATLKEIPCVTIEDAPRFKWRGMLLDVSRHFFSTAEVKRLIDLNARHKLNVFHWHLTDDGGWRMESKAHPLLTTRGAWRSYPPKGKWDYSNIVFPEKRKGDEYGGFYSQKEIREVVEYAAKRHVTVVPEIEMPGHSQSALQCYPEVGHDNLPAGQKSFSFCGGKEETFRFLEKELDETMTLFPSKFIHIGGDEVEKSQWVRCPRCQERMKSEGLKSVDELQSYFIRRIDKYLASKGRRLLGWDEILEGGLAPGAAVMSWRGIGGGIAAARQGKDVVMSPTSHLYLDYSYDTIPTELVYAYDPIPKELSAAEGERVLGAQGNVWTEWLADIKDVERMAYPRAAALAEAVWTPLARKSWPDFSQRLNDLLQTYDRLGMAYRIDAPVVERTAYLTDEYVSVVLPKPPSGWKMRVRGDTPLPPGTATAMVPPGTKLSLAFVRGSDGAVSPESVIRVGRGPSRSTTDGLSAGLAVSGVKGAFAGVGAFSGPFLGSASTIDLALRPAPEKFAMRFAGFIRLPKDGDYAFTLRSDDGSVLKIGGLTIVNNDGEHGAVSRTGTVRAKAGVYPFDLGYFNAGGANSLSVTVNGAAIPADWLWH